MKDAQKITNVLEESMLGCRGDNVFYTFKGRTKWNVKLWSTGDRFIDESNTNINRPCFKEGFTCSNTKSCVLDLEQHRFELGGSTYT